MKRPMLFTFLTLTMCLQNCDNNVTISDQASRYVKSIHITNLTDADHIPPSVKDLLASEDLLNKNPVKFPLAYYLIQAEDIKVSYSRDFDKAILSQLYIEISGVRYYKLFVHPDVDYSYSFLKHAYRYIGPDNSELYATPSSSKKTLIVWSKEPTTKRPAFVVKTEIDNRTIPQEERIPANEVESMPNYIKMVFHRPIKGSKEPIEGQQINAIPTSSK